MRIPQKLILLLLSLLLLSGCTAQTKPAVSPDPPPGPIAAPAEPLTWDDVGMEGDALFPVKKDGLWGFINKDSQIVIPLQFEEVQAFSQGFAAVRQGEHWGFVDRTGDMVFAPAWQAVKPFRDQRAAVQGDDGQWGYIDTTGKLVIPYQFDIARNFRDQVAIVTADDQYGLIDQDGTFLIDCCWTTISLANPRGFFTAVNHDGYQLFSAQGQPVLDRPAQHAFMISDTLYAMQRNGRYTLCRAADQQPITEKTWPVLRPVSEHNVIAKVSGGYQLLTLDDTQITHTSDTWDNIHFSNIYGTPEFFSVDRAGRYGVIDRLGQVVVSPQWDETFSMHNGLALVEKDHLTGVISLADAHLVLEPSSPHVQILPNSYIVYRNNERDGSYGIMAADGTVIWPPQWSTISAIGMNTFVVCTKTDEPRYGVVDAQGNVIIEPQWSEISHCYSFTDEGQTYQYVFALKDGQYSLLFVEEGEPPAGYYLPVEDIVEA